MKNVTKISNHSYSDHPKTILSNETEEGNQLNKFSLTSNIMYIKFKTLFYNILK